MMESVGVRVSLDTRDAHDASHRNVAEWECRVGQSYVCGAHDRRTNSNVSFWPVHNNAWKVFAHEPWGALFLECDSRKTIFPSPFAENLFAFRSAACFRLLRCI